MSIQRNSPRPRHQDGGSRKARPIYRQPASNTPTTTDRVVVFEAASAAQDIIRVSIETVRSTRMEEQVIVF